MKQHSNRDSSAVHINSSGEINSVTEKATPVDADLLLIEDSAASNVKKKIQIGNITLTDSDAIHDNVANEITAITEKTSLTGNDEFVMEDSAASYVKKSIKASNLDLSVMDNSTAVFITSTGVTYENLNTNGDVGTTINTVAAGNDSRFVTNGNSHDHSGGDGAQIDHTTLSNIGTNTHAQIDTHISSNGSDHTYIDQDVTSGSTPTFTGTNITGLPAGCDSTAIHDNVSGEIAAITEKASPVSADLLIIEDSEASNVKKRVQITNLPTGADSAAIHDNVASEISAVTEKGSPVSADLLLIEDSADSNNKKRVQIGNLPTGSDAAAIHDDTASEITAITEKTSLAANDEFIMEDSAASEVKKSIKASNFDLSVMNNSTSAFITSTGVTRANLNTNGDIGIGDDKIVEMDDADAADNDYAKFTANGLEGRSYAEVKTDLSLSNVEDTAISTWAGSANITTVGTVGTGTWQATAVDHERGGLEADVSGYNGLVKISGGSTSAITDSSTNWDAAYTHVSNNGSDHSYIDQDVTSGATPTFGAGNFTGLPARFCIAASDETTDLSTGTAKTTIRMPCAMTVTEVRANVNTAPVGSTIIVDINESGTTILSTKLTIDASEKSSETAATPAVISDSALADDAEITIDIDQVGSSTAGKGLKVWIIGTEA